MSTSHIVRHGRTGFSAAYRVNGDPTAAIMLDEIGVAQCARQAESADWLDSLHVTLTSRFPRTKQTADLLLGAREVHRIVDGRLDEIDYGIFEGGPWLAYGTWLRAHSQATVPAKARESWHTAVHRLLDGMESCLRHPGPRLVVGHGLMLSVLLALRNSPRSHGPRHLPEAPYVDPVVLTDGELTELIDRGRMWWA